MISIKLLILTTVQHIKGQNMQKLTVLAKIPEKRQDGRINKVMIYVKYMYKLNFTLKILAVLNEKNYCCKVSKSSQPEYQIGVAS